MSKHYQISNSILSFQTELTFFEVPSIFKKMKSDNRTFETIDLKQVAKIDSAGVALLSEIIENSPKSIELINVRDEHRKIIDTFSSEGKGETIKGRKKDFLEQVHFWIKDMVDSTKGMLMLTSEVVVWSILDLFSTKGRKKGAVLQQSILLGVNAFTIISLMSIILGLILALQSAAQLRQFGANIFVADLLAISMVREMGPMMTAIIVAGRSGSSIASEIATMKVSEELDALKTMAINPIRYVIVPKFIAITFCMPLLVTISIIMGIFGGLIVALTYLDLSANAFVNQLFNVLTIKDISIGLSKSFFFAWNIVLIGAYFGLKVEGGAEGVGRVTTQSVVVSIFAVIIFDAIFSLFYMI
ncbi:MAG: MlaE family lipid ABC transporter permease subunit [Fidelibacterota bacterium]